MYFARKTLVSLLFIGIFLTSCGGQGAASPTPDINATIAVGAQTMVAAVFQTQTALAPTITNTSPPTVTSLPTSTALLLPSPLPSVTQAILFYNTATPTGTFYTSTPLASSLGVGCNNLRLISSYTDPDSPLLPGQDFTQFWQVENNGTCDWLYLYAVVFVSGDKLGEATSVRFGNKIPPGKWTTLSVNLHAPNDSGTYKSSWRFSDGNTSFGATLPVSITVSAPTKTPKPPTATNTLAVPTATCTPGGTSPPC